ncbi:MAG TPA: hypothetical protein VMU19_13985, partial [Bryobacteraceae bacterium]|nr:hypothetical protein [Bryobacteraceae bacterium]
NWELSTDRANAARRAMQQSGLGPTQVTQVRGFADQQLRNPKDPEDPANRRISLLVHHLDKPGAGDATAPENPLPGAAGSAGATSGGAPPPAAPQAQTGGKKP